MLPDTSELKSRVVSQLTGLVRGRLSRNSWPHNTLSLLKASPKTLQTPPEHPSQQAKSPRILKPKLLPCSASCLPVFERFFLFLFLFLFRGVLQATSDFFPVDLLQPSAWSLRMENRHISNLQPPQEADSNRPLVPMDMVLGRNVCAVLFCQSIRFSQGKSLGAEAG